MRCLVRCGQGNSVRKSVIGFRDSLFSLVYDLGDCILIDIYLVWEESVRN